MHLVPYFVAVGIVRLARSVERIIGYLCGDIVRAFEDGSRENRHHHAVQKLVAVGEFNGHDVGGIAVADFCDHNQVVVDARHNNDTL